MSCNSATGMPHTLMGKTWINFRDWWKKERRGEEKAPPRLPLPQRQRRLLGHRHQHLVRRQKRWRLCQPLPGLPRLSRLDLCYLSAGEMPAKSLRTSNSLTTYRRILMFVELWRARKSPWNLHPENLRAGYQIRRKPHLGEGQLRWGDQSVSRLGLLCASMVTCMCASWPVCMCTDTDKQV